MSELYHYGIKGQKWGVKNGPPYPLSESRKSSAEKRLSKARSTKIGSAESDALINLGITAATYTAIVLLAGKALPRLRVNAEKNDHYTKNTKPIKQIKHPHSESEDQTAINKAGFDTGRPEFRMNCTMCTASYDLRRRGYDVKANTSRVGRDFKDIASWYKDTTKKDFFYTRKYDDLKASLENEPEGARGNICAGVGMFDSSHSMVWEKKNGKVIIRDCQSNTLYNSMDDSIIRQKSRHKYGYIRTDNREIDWTAIRDAAVPREE